MDRYGAKVDSGKADAGKVDAGKVDAGNAFSWFLLSHFSAYPYACDTPHAKAFPPIQLCTYDIEINFKRGKQFAAAIRFVLSLTIYIAFKICAVKVFLLYLHAVNFNYLFD